MTTSTSAEAAATPSPTRACHPALHPRSFCHLHRCTCRAMRHACPWLPDFLHACGLRHAADETQTSLVFRPTLSEILMQYVEAYQQAGESSDTLLEEVRPLPGI